MKFFGTGLTTVTALAILTACSSGRHDRDTKDEAVTTSASAIQGGAADPLHPYAVGLCGTKGGGSKGNCSAFCSGALIAPNLVVTARHCVTNSPEQIDCATATFGALTDQASGFFITTNPSMDQATLGWHSVAKIITPTPTKVCGNDIALLILTSNVSAQEATPVTPIVQYPMTDHMRYSTTQTAIGYGITAPDTNTQGSRRIRQNIEVVCIPGDKSGISCGDTAQALAQRNMSENEFEAGDGTCSGDSGSSAYEQTSFTKGTPESFGVLSRGGISSDGTTCVGAVYTRLDKWRDLIVSAVTEASTKGGYPMPSWTVYVPPPAMTDGGTKPPVDAGAATPDPVPAVLGAACEEDQECASGACKGLNGAALTCTEACSEAMKCSKGFVCTAGFCFAGVEAPTPEAGPAPTAAPTTTTTTTTTGCSIGRADPTPVPWRSVGLGLMVVVAAVRRRRGTARPSA